MKKVVDVAVASDAACLTAIPEQLFLVRKV
jgi:hypothetical protein